MAAAKRRTRKKKSSALKFSKVAVTALLLSVAAFTVAMIAVFVKTGGIPDTLVTAFFAFAGGEAGCMSLIKYSDNKYTDNRTTMPSDSESGDGPAAG